LAATTQKLIIEAAWKIWLPFHHNLTPFSVPEAERAYILWETFPRESVV